MRKMILAVLLAAMLLAGCTAVPAAPADVPAGQIETTFTFLDVGKADAAIITWQDHAVLVDAGKNKSGERIVERLAELGVGSLDAMFITHFDKDHVGGADAVLKAVPVKTVLEPNYTDDSKQIQQYREALSEAEVHPQVIAENTELEIGGVRFVIDVPDRLYDQENDRSLVIRVETGAYTALLAADAENDRLGELLDQGDLKCDLLKVPHHGGIERFSESFFRECGAEYAVICCSDADAEDPETVEALREAGSIPYLTRHGDIVIVFGAEGIRAEQ